MEKHFTVGAQTAKILSVHTDLDTVVSNAFAAVEPIFGPDIDMEFTRFLDAINDAQAELRRFVSENIEANLWDTVNTERDIVEL